MKLSRLQAVLACLLMGAALVSQAADSTAKPKQSVSKTQTTGRYRLVEGKGYTVCEQFLKNLNAFPTDEPPMVCGAKVHPTHQEFSLPAWEEMDVQSNLRLIYSAESQIWRFTKVGTKPLPYEEWLVKFQQRLKSGEIKPRLSKTVLSLNQLGPETLISYEPVLENCTSESDWRSSYVGRYIFVLRENSDVPLQDFGGLFGQEADLLSYKGKPYFLSANGTIQNVSGEVKNIWDLSLARIGDRLTNNGAYLRAIRCEYHTDLINKPSIWVH